MDTSRARQAWPYAAAGALGAASGAAVGHLVAAVVAPAASPVLAVGSAVVDATPTPVKEWAVATMGAADKPVLVASVAVVTLVAAAAIGVLSRRRPSLAYLLLALLAGIAGLAALLQPAAAPQDVLPALVTALTGVGVLSGLRRLLPGASPSALPTAPASPAGPACSPGSEPESPLSATAYGTGEGDRPSRRTFLVAAAGTGAGAATLGALGQRLAAPEAVSAADLPAPRSPLAPLPAGLEREVAGLSPFRTPNDRFYRVDTSLIVPRVSARDWSLEIDGDVDRPFRLSYDELLALPMVERDITMTCVSNEVGGRYVGSARWLGVPTRELLDRAGVRPGVDQVLSTSTSGFTISTPVQALTDDRDALVAVAMNGEPLPPSHGYPVRLVTPGLYGFVGSTKWLARLTATTYAREQAYWTERGWATDAPVLTQSRIDTPGGLRDLEAGSTVPIGGVAWAQGRGISRVEVRVDEEDWQDATLGPEAGIAYWRQWYLPWVVPGGQRRRTLTVRATDGDGQVQTSERSVPFPSGATGWHSRVVLVS